MSVNEQTDVVKETPLEKSMKRMGACVSCDCVGFAFTRVADGFRTCVCSHTQWGHKNETRVEVLP